MSLERVMTMVRRADGSLLLQRARASRAVVRVDGTYQDYADDGVVRNTQHFGAVATLAEEAPSI